MNNTSPLKSKQYYNTYALIIMLIYSFVAISLAINGWTKTWTHLGVYPSMKPIFADLRPLQGAALSIKEGFDPNYVNPGDPWGRAQNYPSIWMKIAGIIHIEKESNYVIFILSYILMYILCCYRMLIKYPSIWLILFLISSIQWLIFERGNNDMMMFSFIFLSLQLANDYIISVLIIIPSILKIYPFFAVLY